MKTTAFKALLLASIFATTSSCSLMMPNRSFIDQMENSDDAILAPGVDFPVVSGDTGQVGRSREQINARTPASERSKQGRGLGQVLESETRNETQSPLLRYSSNRTLSQSLK